ncbi:RHS repeat-associated core domain-containing protein [Pseudomonas sp. FP198]|jgi:RHS repeat-associated protein|uniref:RHS repeat-associated core domain-containing protein n=1 Tax=Pseudomonas sp. FP198 TaxID=2954084 RepID=UPI0027329391|nr:RHS repeat-associated core domain-containing protein [Pseudomonas sp. FP198]WLG96286.1 RHS repeat-associated core domain-containing protein [Pseudomonas sp. FP198]
MPKNQQTLLCQYQYDPLDRLADCTVTDQASARRFYAKGRISNEIQGQMQRSVVQHGDQLLAQQQCRDGTVETTLLATDRQRSVLQLLDAIQPGPLAYTPYGHRAPANGLLSLLGFNGERADPVTGHYLLGNGYRAFNPVLMRFNSPDSLSPFGAGGLNVYAYCAGDPLNRTDKTGHASGFFAWVMKSISKTRANIYKPLRAESISTLPASSGNLAGAAIESGSEINIRGAVLLPEKNRKALRAIGDPIVRNRAKLAHIESELINLKTSPELVAKKIASENADVTGIISPEILEQLAHQRIPNRIRHLDNKKLHYQTKLKNLQTQRSQVRQQ